MRVNSTFVKTLAFKTHGSIPTMEKFFNILHDLPFYDSNSKLVEPPERKSQNDWRMRVSRIIVISLSRKK